MTVTPKEFESLSDPAAGEMMGAALAKADAARAAGDKLRAASILTDLATRLPGAASVRARLGAYALQDGNYDAACSYLREAVARAPDDAAHWTNLGAVLLRLARTEEAIEALRRALVLDPHRVGAHVNLANAFERTGDVDGAVAEVEAALRIAPDAPEVLNNLGNLYKEQGRFGDAFAAYDGALRSRPDSRVPFSNLLALLKLSTRHTPSEIFALHRAYAERFEPEWQSGYVPATNSPDPERRLRVCYVSPDCHTALPPFVEPVLRSHDRQRFEVFVYFNNPQPPASMARIAPVTSRVMTSASDDEVARWVRADGIDILVDIAGHTGHNRLGVFGRKPAPIQITWLDYLGTTGLASMDYRLTDVVSDPPGESDSVHSESLLRLTPTQWCWRPPNPSTPPLELPALSTGELTLGSFNSGSKLTDSTLALWARVLVALPRARLVVVGVPPGAAAARIEVALGQTRDGRVSVLPRLPPEEFRRLVSRTDIGLDPLPFSGATTTLEALWQGVPVVTRAGTTSASRSSASILTALGLTSWIAASDDEYVAILERASRSLDALAALRVRLPGMLQQSAICDASRFTAGLEEAFRNAWREWCALHRKGASHRVTTGAASVHPPAKWRAELRVDLDARLARIEAARREGRGTEVVTDACDLVDDEPAWQPAQRVYLQVLLEWARFEPGLIERTFAPPAPAVRRPKVSVIVCSIDPVRFQNVTLSYRSRFNDFPLDIIGIHDARSLAEGYNRGAAKAGGDILVFCHDDIELVNEDFAARLVAHLDAYDGVGVAGASRLTGPRWGDAGARAIHGHILHPPPPGRAGALLMASGFQQPVCEKIVVMDGVFIAVRRHVWETTQFDPVRFDGFHLYDLDFTRRASAGGARLAVPSDLLLFHASQGRYSDEWRRYARRFVDAANLDPRAPPRLGGLQVRLETRELIDLMRAAMVHFHYGRPRPDRADRPTL